MFSLYNQNCIFSAFYSTF